MNNLQPVVASKLSYEQPLTFPLLEPYSVRVYPDSRPHNMETAVLHKGLVLMANSQELIQEGMGFGVPVVKYRDKTYFSSNSQTIVQKSPSVIIKRRFVLDCISKKTIGKKNINDSFYHILQNKFSFFYLSYIQFSTFFNGLMELRSLLGIRTKLQKVLPRGAVTVTYSLAPSEIVVSVDFAEITTEGVKEFIVLNEQGSIFNKYVDSSGLILSNARIGGWSKVLANEASLHCSDYQARFSLKAISTSQLYRGREAIKHRFSWSGLNYSIPANTRNFNYSIYLTPENRLKH